MSQLHKKSLAALGNSVTSTTANAATRTGWISQPPHLQGPVNIPTQPIKFLTKNALIYRLIPRPSMTYSSIFKEFWPTEFEVEAFGSKEVENNTLFITLPLRGKDFSCITGLLIYLTYCIDLICSQWHSGAYCLLRHLRN